MDVFFLTLENMAVYIAFMLAGMRFAKRRLLPQSAGRTLSFLITNLFTPAICFNAFAQKFTIEKISEYAIVLAAGCAFICINILIAEIVRRVMPGSRYDKLAAAYTTVAPNFGNLGYPLVLALFGQEVLSKYMMFVLPVNLYAFGYIMPQYMPEKGGKAAWVQKLFSPPILMMLAGILYGMTGLSYPSVLKTFCGSASDCLAPVSFLVAGLAMGARPLRPIFLEPRAYVLSAMRLILLPFFSILGAYALCKYAALPAEILPIIGIYSCLPTGSNPIIFAEAYGGDGRLAESCMLISMIAALATLPCARLLIDMLCAML